MKGGCERMNCIKKVRESKHISQKWLAENANISQPYLYDLENNRRGATQETLQRIADALGVAVTELQPKEEPFEKGGGNQMTKRDTEMALLKIGEAIKAIAQAYNRDLNHVTVSVNNGMIIVYACKTDDNNTENPILQVRLDAAAFPDGRCRLGDEYVNPKDVT